MSPENFSPIKSVISGRFDAIELCLQVPLFGSTINIYLILILDLQLFSFGDARASSRKEHVGSSLCPITGPLNSLDRLKNLTHPTTITLSATNLNYQRLYVHVHLYLSSFLPHPSQLEAFQACLQLFRWWTSELHESNLHTSTLFLVASSQWRYLRRVYFTGCPQFLIGARSGELWELK